MSCIGAEIASEEDQVIIVTEKGYGKRTPVSEYRETRRGSKGVKALNISEKNGYIASFKIFKEDSDLVIITNEGMVMRMDANQISTLGRVTQGTRLIKLKEENVVSTVSLVDKIKDEEEPVEEVDNNQVINKEESNQNSNEGNN